MYFIRKSVRMIAYIHVLTPFIERGEVTLVSQAMPNFDDVPGMYVCMYVIYVLYVYMYVWLINCPKMYCKCMYVCVYSYF